MTMRSGRIMSHLNFGGYIEYKGVYRRRLGFIDENKIAGNIRYTIAGANVASSPGSYLSMLIWFYQIKMNLRTSVCFSFSLPDKY